MESTELSAGLQALRAWADDTHELFQRQCAQKQPAPKVSGGAPKAARPNSEALSGVRDSLKKMSKESRPKSALSSARNSSVPNSELLAQLDGGGVKKLQGSMKRKKVKPLPSMPTHADIISAVIRLQKDSAQSYEAETELRRGMDVVNALGGTLLQAFSNMIGLSEQLLKDTQATRNQLNCVSAELNIVRSESIEQIRGALQQHSTQITGLASEITGLRGNPSQPKVGSCSSLADVHATACRMADHLQEETARKLEAELTERQSHENQLLEKLEKLEDQSLKRHDQLEGAIKTDLESLSIKLSELMAEVSENTESLRREDLGHRQDLQGEISGTEQKQRMMTEQIQTLAQTHKVLNSKLDDAENRGNQSMARADRCFQHTKDELNHMYSVLARHISYDMGADPMRISGPGPGSMPPPVAPIHDAFGMHPGSLPPGAGLPRPGSPFSPDGRPDLQRDDDLRSLEARLDSIIQQSATWSP